MWDAHRTLEAVAGSAWWFDEFQPIEYAERYLDEYLLCVLCEHDLCCDFTGAFACYTAGLIGGSRPVSVCGRV